MPAPVLDGVVPPGQLAALRLAANGLTSRQIAGRLGVSEQAIHLRLKVAAKSLGASSRTHAVAVALRLGVLALEEVHVPGGISAATEVPPRNALSAPLRPEPPRVGTPSRTGGSSGPQNATQAREAIR
jgi:DNA-binding CsgD family transcriptional regulator